MKNAFSLIEMLIVLSILGIISAIAIPATANLAEDGKQQTLQNRIQAVEVAKAMYAASSGFDAVVIPLSEIEARVDGDHNAADLKKRPLHSPFDGAALNNTTNLYQRTSL